MESYHKRTNILEEKYGRLINVTPFNTYTGTAMLSPPRRNRLSCLYI